MHLHKWEYKGKYGKQRKSQCQWSAENHIHLSLIHGTGQGHCLFHGRSKKKCKGNWCNREIISYHNISNHTRHKHHINIEHIFIRCKRTYRCQNNNDSGKNRFRDQQNQASTFAVQHTNQIHQQINQGKTNDHCINRICMFGKHGRTRTHAMDNHSAEENSCRCTSRNSKGKKRDQRTTSYRIITTLSCDNSLITSISKFFRCFGSFFGFIIAEKCRNIRSCRRNNTNDNTHNSGTPMH